jgi:hypothetical protein
LPFEHLDAVDVAFDHAGVQGSLSLLVTASWSARSPVTKEQSAGSPVARAAVIHPLSRLRPRRSVMMRAKSRTLAVTAASSGEAARIGAACEETAPTAAPTAI